jgi:hypothetical protein
MQKAVNLVSTLPEEKQKEISEQVIADYGVDLNSRKEWEDKRNKWYKLWVGERDKKTWPNGTNRSNVNVPMLAIASTQFHSRAYQSIFSAPDLVKAIPFGSEDERAAKNIEKFMNWQLRFEMREYEDVFDRMLQLLPINGIAFKKISYDGERDCPKTAFINPLDLVLPYRTRTLEDALLHTRVVHRLWLHYSELEDRSAAGMYENFDQIEQQGATKKDESLAETGDKVTGESAASDTQNPHLILECHKRIDIGDGKKAYTITVDYDSGAILRIASREFNNGKYTLNHFVDYHFIPNPEGFYSFGFGHFLEQLNEMANTSFNQIFDSGSLTNRPFMFYERKAGIKSKKIQLSPGGAYEVQNTQGVMFPTMQRVDQTLFMVLNYITDYSQQFTSTSDYIMGRENRGTKTPTKGGTEAIIEQGLVTFSVMTKRIYRSLKKELEIIAAMNRLFLPDKKEYRIVSDVNKIAFPDVKRDQFESVYDVTTTADPSFSSMYVRRQEAMEVYQVMMQNPLVVGNPEAGIKPNIPAMTALAASLLETYKVRNKHEILPEAPEPSIPPGMENAMFLQGDYVDPKNGENHAEHIAVHEEFKTAEFYGEMSKKDKELLEQHIKKTREVAYIDEQAQQMAAPQLQAPGPEMMEQGMSQGVMAPEGTA